MLHHTLFRGELRDESPLEFKDVELKTVLGNIHSGTKFDGATIDPVASVLTLYNLDEDGVDVAEHHSFHIYLSLDPNEIEHGSPHDVVRERL